MSDKFAKLYQTFEEMTATSSAVVEDGLDAPEDVPEMQLVDEAQLIDAEASGKELEDMVAAGGAADETQTKLTELAVMVESSEKRGGMSSAMAQVVAFTHECIVSNLGYTTRGKNPTAKKVVPSLEGFRKDDTRLGQTRYTAESLREQAKAVGAKAKEIVLKIYERFKAFIQKVFDERSTSQLINALNTIDRRLGGLKNRDVSGINVNTKDVFSTPAKASEVFDLGNKAMISAARCLRAEFVQKSLVSGGDIEVDSFDDELRKVKSSAANISSGESKDTSVMKPLELLALSKTVRSFVESMKEFRESSMNDHWLMLVLAKAGNDPSKVSGAGTEVERVYRQLLSKETEVIREVGAPLLRLTREFIRYAGSSIRAIEESKGQ